ncbi:hypothetical protein Y1Q_0011996 [Alligator mississippiensis]|uniref:Uncharacterized protein n=1 Tax=Alligator mississippiensis TaxID=8496 RepID=A0A151NH93_ALLMI|nr:hypothetical protein Y1Q_0011996 [Alligator mississippiensis]
MYYPGCGVNPFQSREIPTRFTGGHIYSASHGDPICPASCVGWWSEAEFYQHPLRFHIPKSNLVLQMRLTTTSLEKCAPEILPILKHLPHPCSCGTAFSLCKTDEQNRPTKVPLHTNR